MFTPFLKFEEGDTINIMRAANITIKMQFSVFSVFRGDASQNRDCKYYKW